MRRYDVVPEHVRKQYAGGAREFKAEKRRQLRAAWKAVNDLSGGCAYFPGEGAANVDEVRGALAAIGRQINVKQWGR